MRRKIFVLLLLVGMTATGIDRAAAASSPEAALAAVAAAIRNKDAKAFRTLVDVGALFDVSFAESYEGGDRAGFVPFRQQEIDTVLEGIASGTFARECAEAVKPGCPWFPDGLDKAGVDKPDAVSAIAGIDSRKDIRTWLVLHRTADGWKVIAAPSRFRLAETYATGDFQKKLAEYRETVRKQFEREAARDARYKKGAAEAAKKAAAILETVRVDSLTFSLGSGEDENRLTIGVTATNGYRERLRLCAIVMEILDMSGNIVETRKYQHTTGYMEPGGSVHFSMTTSMSTEEKLDMARKLVKGVYTAKARSTYVMIGNRNLHIDETGGGLKPAR